MSSPWRPLLQPDLASQALEAAVAIEETLRACGDPADPESVWEATIAMGRAGQALLPAYLALHTGDETYADAALSALGQASEALARVPMSESLFLGFPGVAWAAEHLEGRIFEADEDGNLEIDEAVLHALSKAPEPGRHDLEVDLEFDLEFDLIYGITGLGIYALERLPRPTAASCLERVVAHLEARAETGPEGAAWFNPPGKLQDFEREIFPEGLYNLGTAHGVGAVLTVLGGASRAGIAGARPLLERAVSWLLARRQDPDRGFAFPHCFHPGVEPQLSRLAWCYGDLGLSAALLAAARAAGEPTWETAALEVARAAAARPVEASGVLDAGLCHGAAGAGHLFNRMYQVTGDEDLGAAARVWFERALVYRQPGEGIAGFRAWSSREAGWRQDPGFLEGAAGIGLALLAAASSIEPAWDRLLAISLPEISPVERIASQGHPDVPERKIP